MNPYELDENPYYSKLISITTEPYKTMMRPTITVLVTVEGHEFEFERQLIFMDKDSTKEEIEKFFNDEMLGQEINLTDMKCYSGSSTCDLDYQMRAAYISPNY